MNTQYKNQSTMLAIIIIGVIIVVVVGYYLYSLSSGTPSFPIVTAPSTTATSTVVVATSSSQSTQIDTSSWQIYTNSELGYAIQYPVGLIIDSSAPGLFKASFPRAHYFSTVYGDDVSLSVYVNADCPPIIEGSREAPATNITIGGIDFVKKTSGDVAAGNVYEIVGYNTLNNNACYQIIFSDHHANGAGLYENDPVKMAALTTARDTEFAHVTAIVNAMISSFTFINTPVGQDESTYTGPVISIDSVAPGTASVGNEVTISGSGFLGHDTVVWITNGSTKGVLWGGMPASDDNISTTLPAKVCTIYNGASGLPCPSYLVLVPGTYAVYVVNQNGVTDTVYLKIK